MKRLSYLIAIILLTACSNENTDVSVKTNETPVQLHVEVDTIPPMLDTLIFNQVALDCFYHLGQETGGDFYYKTAAESVHKTILEVIRDHGENGSDIVFLIDKTGSMQNDIDSVRINLSAIIQQLKKLKNIRLAAAAYGDKNVDGKNWYHQSKISSDFAPTKQFINDLKVSDGGDYPESVYDGLAELIQNTAWRKDTKKVILVIGDAPSLEGSLSAYNRKEIIDLCAKNGIKANLFPVLVTPYNVEAIIDFAEYSDKFLLGVYPNPASDYLKLKFSKKGRYAIGLVDFSGKMVLMKRATETEVKLDIGDDIPDGNYVLRVIDLDDDQVNAKKVVIKK